MAINKGSLSLKFLYGQQLLPLWTFAAGLTLVHIFNTFLHPECESFEFDRDGALCQTVEPDFQSCKNSYDSGVKLMNRPAPCPLKGFLIEELDPEVNYRRSWAYGHANSAEDRTHPHYYLRAAQDLSMHSRSRRVYLDLGGRFFNSSVTWFCRNYPLDFTEIHVFEANKIFFQIPGHHSMEEEELENSEETGIKRPLGMPVPLTNDVLDTVKLYTVSVSTADGEIQFNGTAVPTWNITRFIKQELNLTKDDTLVVKMDIEVAEYDILNAWMEDPSMHEIVDEIFVEIHYQHPSMAVHQWDTFAPHTREAAQTLLENLRKKGFFVHTWP